MQQSSFNVRVPLPGGHDVFIMNTFTDAQAIVPSGIGDLLARVDTLDLSSLGAEDRETLQDLAANGFIVRDRGDERRAVEAYFRDVRESSDLLRVTVLTTLQCNFSCTYCYQGDHGHPGGGWNAIAEKMSVETAARVGDWMAKRLDEVRPKRFAMMFFGGEPLLNVPVVEYLSRRMRNETARRGIPMSFTIVTNGLLLTRELVERLVPAGLSGIKVTLDGDRETHNRLRPLRGGQGTFDRIVRNIRDVADLCAVSIGGNFDESSVNSYPALLEFLRAQDFAPKLAKVAFKPIIREKPAKPRADSKPGAFIPLTAVDDSGRPQKPLSGTCMTVAGTGAQPSASACDSCGLLDGKMAWLRDETRRNGFATLDGVHMGPCEIHRQHSYTIGPDGSLYACPGFTGEKSQSVGHIDGRQDGARARAASAFERLAAWKECQDCAFIPVCAGGCTVAAHAEYGDVNKPNCHKRSFEEGVASLAREAVEQLRPALAS
jgi:uncharacterized protein